MIIFFGLYSLRMRLVNFFPKDPVPPVISIDFRLSIMIELIFAFPNLIEKPKLVNRCFIKLYDLVIYDYEQAKQGKPNILG